MILYVYISLPAEKLHVYNIGLPIYEDPEEEKLSPAGLKWTGLVTPHKS